MKKFICFFVFCFSIINVGSVFCEDTTLGLINCTCQRWNTFEQDYAKDSEKLLGYSLTDSERKIEMTTARNLKLIYIAGLIDAYQITYARTKDEYYHLPFRVGQYEQEINIYSEDPRNAKMLISGVLLIVNKRLRDSGR